MVSALTLICHFTQICVRICRREQHPTDNATSNPHTLQWQEIQHMAQKLHKFDAAHKQWVRNMCCSFIMRCECDLPFDGGNWCVALVVQCVKNRIDRMNSEFSSDRWCSPVGHQMMQGLDTMWCAHNTRSQCIYHIHDDLWICMVIAELSFEWKDWTLGDLDTVGFSGDELLWCTEQLWPLHTDTHPHKHTKRQRSMSRPVTWKIWNQTTLILKSTPHRLLLPFHNEFNSSIRHFLIMRIFRAIYHGLTFWHTSDQCTSLLQLSSFITLSCSAIIHSECAKKFVVV